MNRKAVTRRESVILRYNIIANEEGEAVNWRDRQSTLDRRATVAAVRSVLESIRRKNTERCTGGTMIRGEQTHNTQTQTRKRKELVLLLSWCDANGAKDEDDNGEVGEDLEGSNEEAERPDIVATLREKSCHNKRTYDAGPGPWTGVVEVSNDDVAPRAVSGARRFKCLGLIIPVPVRCWSGWSAL